MSQEPKVTESTHAGLEDSFEQLVLEHHQLVRVFLARYIHCREQVEDLAQEVFIAGFRQMKQFRHDSKVSTWLLGIARNKALEFIRAEIRRKDRRQEFAEAEAYRLALANVDRESDLNLHEARIAALHDCINLLPAQSKRLVQQFYFDKHTSVQIARESGQKESAVRMKLKRIRGVLQACICSKLPNEPSSQVRS